MNALREGYKPARLGEPLAPTVIKKYAVASVQDDFLVCHPFKSDQVSQNFSITRFIMKPWSLRRTPFDSSDPYDAAAYNGITYTYQSNIQRTAASGVSVGATLQVQTITPAYNGNDVIYATTADESFSIKSNGTPFTTPFIDLNLDARHWGFPGGNFTVALVQVAGSAGTRTTACSFTYDLYQRLAGGAKGIKLASSLSPLMPRQVKAAFVAATAGTAFYDPSGTLILADAWETWTQTPC